MCRNYWVVRPDLVEQIRCYLSHFQKWHPNNSLSRPNTGVQELLQKRARLEALLEARNTEDMLAFFRTRGVAAIHCAAVEKLLAEDGLRRGRSAAVDTRAHPPPPPARPC